MYGTYEQFQHTYAKTLQSNVKVNNLKARLRKYDSARHASLAANFIPESVYDTLVAAVNKHLPLLHRYINLRKKLLGIDDLKMYDMYTPLSDFSTKISYEDALKKCQETLEIFGEDYSTIVKEAFENRWIDVHLNEGKRSGAYSGGAYDTNAFMLLNWQDNLDNMYTLIHETGHSLHSMLTRKTQPYVYGHYSLFLAEIASTTNENLLTEKLLAEVEDDKERFAILNHYLDGFRGTVFRQTQFAEFEQAIYKADQEGQVLTADFLNELYGQTNEKYYGLSAEENPEIQFEWARIPHFYYNFYVYQYATGFAAASALANKIVNGSPEDKENYLNYLKAGSSDYSLNVIAKAGVDMTKEDYLNDAFKVFEARLTELEELVEKGYISKMISYKRSIVIPSVISLVFILLGLGGLTRPEPSVGSVVYLIFLQPLLVYLYILRKQKAVFILTTQYIEFQEHFWSERQRHSLEEIAEIRYLVSPVYRGYQSKRLRIVGNKGYYLQSSA